MGSIHIWWLNWNTFSILDYRTLDIILSKISFMLYPKFKFYLTFFVLFEVFKELTLSLEVSNILSKIFCQKFWTKVVQSCQILI